MKVPRILLTAPNYQNLQVLREYAEFWKIPHIIEQGEDEHSTVFNSGTGPKGPQTGQQWIVCPSSWDDAKTIADKFRVRVTSKTLLLRLPASKKANVAIHSPIYDFEGSKIEPVIVSEETTILSQVSQTNVFLLSVDIVSEYSRRMYQALHDPPSLKFRIATTLPFSYKTIPSFIRNSSFRSSLSSDSLTEEKLGPVEALRTIFLASLTIAAQRPIPRIWFWRRGKSSALAVTHDVETRNGLLQGAKSLSKVERRFGVRPTWNVPSSRFPILPGDLNSIVKYGELGGHDTTHDGRLGLLRPEQIVERLSACKKELEERAGVEVIGFRSPLLQHSKELMVATAKAGFRFDSSVPSWEALSPMSFREHGSGTVFPFMIDGCLEIPVSLPQDHQLVRVMGLSPSQAVDQLRRISFWIREIGGANILLVHPDYEFASSDLPEYERLLGSLVRPDCDVMTLGELADWWRFRSSARLKVEGERVEIRDHPNRGLVDALELQLVTGYGRDGFRTEVIN